jgi:hypothetical protein
MYWIFDANGKPVTRQLGDNERSCTNLRPGDDGVYSAEQITSDAGNLSLADTDERLYLSSARGSGCRQFTLVMNQGLAQAPLNMKMPSLTVIMESPRLLCDGMMATHQWMQGQLDAKNKKLDNDAKQRAAPVM